MRRCFDWRLLEISVRLMNTLLLTSLGWDLTIDASRNIAMASEPYACAQDAASEIRLFEGELYFDGSQGVPYWALILGKQPPISLIKQKFVDAALNVPDVVSAVCYLGPIVDRAITGQVQVTDVNGNVGIAAI